MASRKHNAIVAGVASTDVDRVLETLRSAGYDNWVREQDEQVSLGAFGRKARTRIDR